MYDSDEVRDEARWAILWGTLPDRPPEDYSAAERAAVADALSWYWQERQRLALEAYAKLAELMTEALESFAAALRSLGSAIIEALGDGFIGDFGKGWGLSSRPGERPRSGRRRRAYVRPVHLVDAVAAGRHPAMVMWTWIRGGRR